MEEACSVSSVGVRRCDHCMFGKILCKLVMGKTELYECGHFMDLQPSIKIRMYLDIKHLHIVFISVINQLDAQNFCFTISLFHASTCFEHMCSLSGGQNCITQPLHTCA